MQISFNFVSRDNGPERLLSEAEVIFGADAGLFSGLKLVGFSLWSGPDGDVYVTLPSRAFGAGAERRYFDYLRGDGDGVKRLKAAMVKAYQAQAGQPAA